MSNFQFVSYLSTAGCYIQPPKSTDSVGVNGVFPYLFCCANLIFEFKQSLEVWLYPEKFLTTKMKDISMKL